MLRGLAVPIGAVAAVLLVLLFNPWVEITGDIRSVVNVAFWVLFIVLLLALFEDRKAPEAEDVDVDEPRFARFLFHNSRAGLFWLPIRLFVGFASRASRGSCSTTRGPACSGCRSGCSWASPGSKPVGTS